MDPTNTASTDPAAAGTANPAPVEAAPTAAAPTVTPATDPAAGASVNADVANAALNPPVNPVVAPGATQGVNPAANPVANPVATPAANPVASSAAAVGGTMSMNQMFQTQPANNANVLDETTAIAVPEGPKPPDPVEEELKAPMKAAAPAPGSIGSAVSGPADENSPASVAFNDPAMAGENPMAANTIGGEGDKKTSAFEKLMIKTNINKSTLILLSVIAGIIVVLLIVVLVMVATGVF